MSKYAFAQSDRVCTSGGSVRMTIADNVAQGNGGTSLPCRVVWLLANNDDVRVTIGTACTATTGIELPYDDGSDHMQPLQIFIDDVSSLYFYGGTDGKTVDCLYAM